MLMNGGALPPSGSQDTKKTVTDTATATTTVTTATTAEAATTTSSTPKKSGSDKASSSSTAKKSKSKRKSLVEGREARVVKPKFSLEQEMSLSDELQKCLTLLKAMFRQDEYEPFYYAVDPVRLNIPDYWDVIKHPMDMTKIKENLLSGIC